MIGRESTRRSAHFTPPREEGGGEAIGEPDRHGESHDASPVMAAAGRTSDNDYAECDGTVCSATTQASSSVLPRSREHSFGQVHLSQETIILIFWVAEPAWEGPLREPCTTRPSGMQPSSPGHDAQIENAKYLSVAADRYRSRIRPTRTRVSVLVRGTVHMW